MEPGNIRIEILSETDVCFQSYIFALTFCKNSILYLFLKKFQKPKVLFLLCLKRKFLCELGMVIFIWEKNTKKEFLKLKF